MTVEEAALSVEEEQEIEEVEEQVSEEVVESEEEETYRQRYENLQKKMGEHTEELGELRKFREQAAPIIEQVVKKQAAEQPQDDERTQAARPIANKRYQKLKADGYEDDDAARDAWEYAFDITDAAEAAAERKVAPYRERASHGLIAEGVREILAQSGLDGITADDVLAKIKGMPGDQWESAGPAQREAFVMELAKSALMDKVLAGTYVPKGKAKPAPGETHDVNVPSKGRAPSAEIAAYAADLEAQGISGLSPEQVAAAKKRYDAKHKGD